ncbi:MAG: DNA-directed RNA polymerase, partial [Methylibium sp.]
MDNPKWNRQVELEQEMVDAGVARYRSEVEKARAREAEAQTPAGLRLLMQAVEPTKTAIEKFIADAATGKAGRRHLAVKHIVECDATVAAYITARVVLDKISHRDTLQRVGIAIGTAIEDELRFRTFEAIDKEKFDLTRGHLKETKHLRHRRRVMVFQMNRAGIQWDDWTDKTRYHVGVKLFELFAGATGLAHAVLAGRMYRCEATPACLAWLETSHARHALLAPALAPCVIPPKPWTNPLNGGYWTNAIKRRPLVQTRVKGYIDELFGAAMPDVYRAINALQETAWSVNGEVFAVMREMWDRGIGLGRVLPARDHLPLPVKPAWLAEDMGKADMSEEQKAEFKEWKRAAGDVHRDNARLVSRRVQAHRTLSMAEKFLGEEEFFFPHYMDFRGRLYPMVPFLSPQGSDLQRGLLRFAHGKPLGSEVAAGWLAIHGANCWGFDKAALDERIGWVEQNQEAILRVANDPLVETWWQDAENPWMFLAFCFEWAGFVREGVSFVSRLPVALDGSCNGIQHFSAMLRDHVGGAAVNLVPGDKPADIYQRVAEVVIEKLRAEDAPRPEGYDSEDHMERAIMAGRWLRFGIDRKVTKRPVMVLPYGGTYLSCRDYVEEAVRERIAAGAANPWGEDRDGFNKALHYLAATVWASISEVVVASRQVMSWLKACARLAAKTGLPINWQTPVGFWVQQAYRADVAERIESKLFGQRIVVTLLRDDETKLSENDQAQGISPNFVHSLDAAALVSCVNLSLDNGVSSFAMIHDSYGTLAADTEMLGACLRHAFVDMYQSRDVLEEFRQGILEMLPADQR